MTKLKNRQMQTKCTHRGGGGGGRGYPCPAPVLVGVGCRILALSSAWTRSCPLANHTTNFTAPGTGVDPPPSDSVPGMAADTMPSNHDSTATVPMSLRCYVQAAYHYEQRRSYSTYEPVGTANHRIRLRASWERRQPRHVLTVCILKPLSNSCLRRMPGCKAQLHIIGGSPAGHPRARHTVTECWHPGQPKWRPAAHTPGSTERPNKEALQLLAARGLGVHHQGTPPRTTPVLFAGFISSPSLHPMPSPLPPTHARVKPTYRATQRAS